MLRETLEGVTFSECTAIQSKFATVTPEVRTAPTGEMDFTEIDDLPGKCQALLLHVGYSDYEGAKFEWVEKKQGMFSLPIRSEGAIMDDQFFSLAYSYIGQIRTVYGTYDVLMKQVNPAEMNDHFRAFIPPEKLSKESRELVDACSRLIGAKSIMCGVPNSGGNSSEGGSGILKPDEV